MALNKATLKSIGRSVLGVAVGVVIYFSGEPKYAALGAFVPFLLRWVDPSDKEITFGKSLGSAGEKVASAPITVASVETAVAPLVAEVVADTSGPKA